MTWFMQTSPFSAANPCTAAAAERSFQSGDPPELLSGASEAVVAARFGPLADFLYPPVPLLVLAFTAATFCVGPGCPTVGRPGTARWS